MVAIIVVVFIARVCASFLSGFFEKHKITKKILAVTYNNEKFWCMLKIFTIGSGKKFCDCIFMCKVK